MPLARQQGFASINELLGRMRHAPSSDLAQRVVEAMTIHESSFFRDWRPFEAMRQTVIPGLIQARGSRQLTLWSAACSTGQEPYSLAMLIREHFPQLASWSVRILATDISRSILTKAKEGKFSQLEVNRGLPAPFLVKYFTRQGTDWVIRDDIRAMIDFREVNLADVWPFSSSVDVVFIRNVLIYFDAPTKKTILERIHKTLAPDGALFLGAAETTFSLTNVFERAPVDGACWYRRRAHPE